MTLTVAVIIRTQHQQVANCLMRLAPTLAVGEVMPKSSPAGKGGKAFKEDLRTNLSRQSLSSTSFTEDAMAAN
jgi:hypothetical protein